MGAQKNYLIDMVCLSTHNKCLVEKLEYLKSSPDLNNVTIGLGQLRFIIETYFVLPYGHGGHFGQVT